MNRTALDGRVRLAAQAARDAGALILGQYGHPSEVRTKDGRELVTAADSGSEAIIIDAIRREFPHDHIVAEESSPDAASPASGDPSLSGRRVTWIIDPLDGTNNFAHGYPFFCVAIAIEVGEQVVAGVVYDPLRDELFLAERGRGATMNGEKIHVSNGSSLDEAIVATGFPYGRSETTVNNLANLNRFILGVRGVRRGGSAELDLVYVACGRLDGFWELGLKTWDVSAGGVIVLEAGGRVTNVGSGDWDHRRGDVVASNGALHDAMLELVDTN